MDTEPSTPPENPQDEIPEVDRRTLFKAVATAVGCLVVFGLIFLAIRSQFASSDEDAYATVADARRHVVEFNVARPAPPDSFTMHVPIDSRHSKRIETTLADFKGKPVFVSMWASWCRPCHAEMRVLDRLAPDLERLGLVVVPIMTADKAGIDGARFFYRNEEIANLRIYLDHDSRILSGLGVGNLPVGGFIDAEGNLLAITDNLDLREPAAQELLLRFAETGKLPS